MFSRQSKATNDVSVEQALICRCCIVLSLSDEFETSVLVSLCKCFWQTEVSINSTRTSFVKYEYIPLKEWPPDYVIGDFIQRFV